MPENKDDMSAKEQRLLSALGLCARARALVFGTSMICEALRDTSSPLLVIEAADTSENTHKKLTDKCAYYHIRLQRIGADGDTLAQAVGKRSTLAAVAIRGKQFCRLVESTLAAHPAHGEQNEESNK